MLQTISDQIKEGEWEGQVVGETSERERTVKDAEQNADIKGNGHPRFSNKLSNLLIDVTFFYVFVTLTEDISTQMSF